MTAQRKQRHPHYEISVSKPPPGDRLRQFLSKPLSPRPRASGEPWRLGYNLVLLSVAGTWVIAAWPLFRGAIRLVPFLQLLVLALLANVCYSTAYVLDLPLQASSFAARWAHSRWVLWLLGTILAVVLEWYWIGDEIYPDFH